MGIVTFTETTTSSVPATKLFHAIAIDNRNILPKAVPQAIKSIELIEGNGGPGSILHVTYAEGVPVKYAKHKIDVLDKDSLTYVETVIEGGDLSDKIISVTLEFKFESSSVGGCLLHATVKYHITEGAELTEEETKPAKEGALGVIKALEAYLLAN